MVNSHTARLDSIFHALSDGTRRAILRDISRRDKTVGEIAKPYRMSLAAVSKHLKVLEAAELVAERLRDGDVLTVKGSAAMGMREVVTRLLSGQTAVAVKG